MIKLDRPRRAALAAALLAVGLSACAGCAHAPQADAAPPPRTDAHPLPPIPSQYPHPKLPALPGDTRSRPAPTGP